ncbi:hypothetical protein [Candidatus Coxiella mudrowiae]|uniref:hypothetical protein n=1 Tax=Candidatus Coxiella mudrowiae TaxID=2054173 RepID=UPI0012FF021A|nr:hypothetical protein [Candidatus Coxiella mudrowiae]
MASGGEDGDSVDVDKISELSSSVLFGNWLTSLPLPSVSGGVESISLGEGCILNTPLTNFTQFSCLIS